ncbi:hypothetical protein JNUCC1_02812 [Lentibacillus sp. JNUCC-1]|uniref:hypothetical protein n=1 Tax=Lentibacillus sp. JNUCC-1 TaxID=2654513 RepID=UPI0012E777A5|nr:hypothetical protein [Lentibacillus sp. JNUCC-1]MUV38940.1 hypothetical protein [Lentibacillus sp. JNUCC-1]
MKKISFVFIGLLLLCACSTDDPDRTTYGFEQDQAEQKEFEWVLSNSYQITVDDSFEMVSRYERDTAPEEMFFWHEPSANEHAFQLDTTTEALEKEVPTMKINPINKYQYVYMQKYYAFDLTEPEAKESMRDVKEEVNKKSDEFLEDIKEKTIERLENESTVYTNEDYDIEPFTYMIESESEQGVMHYNLVGEAEEEYVRASMSIPSSNDEDLFESMLASLRTLTYNKDEFQNDPVLDEPTKLSYEPADNLKGSYPEVGYSFEIPEAATFRYSYPVFHTYRYTFDTLYDESIEKEHFGLRSSELIIRVAKEENAKNRETEIRNRALDDFVAFQHDYARSVTYLHEDADFNTGVFTTAVRVTFDGYEEYWFLKEVDGHVYEVTFDITLEAPEYDDLLESYLNVIRTFELTHIE